MASSTVRIKTFGYMSGKITLKIPAKRSADALAASRPGPAVTNALKRSREPSDNGDDDDDDGDNDQVTGDEDSDAHVTSRTQVSRPTRRLSTRPRAVSSQELNDAPGDSDEEFAAQATTSSEAENSGPYLPSASKTKPPSSKSKAHSRSRRVVSDSDSTGSREGLNSKRGTRSHLDVRTKSRGTVAAKGVKREASQVEKRMNLLDQRRKGASTEPMETSSSSSRPTPTTNDGEPPTKKKKLPTITKRPTPNLPPKPPPASQGASRASNGKVGLPTAIASGSITGSKDYDLNDASNLAAIMKSAAMASTQTADRDPKQELYDKMRIEARMAREEEAKKDTFDLMAGTEKMKAFEIQLERSDAISAPHILAHPIVRWLSERNSGKQTLPR